MLNKKSFGDETDGYANIRAIQRQIKPTESRVGWIKMEEEIITLREENARLLHDREYLIADLEECKAELFRRMPPTQISDSSIKTVLEQIHRSIDSFVYDVMENVVDDDALHCHCRELQRPPKKKRRRSRNPFHEFVRKANISTWGSYSCSNLYILSVVIQHILDHFVFNKTYPIGLTDEQRLVLMQVEKAMSQENQAPGQAGAHVSLDQQSDRDGPGQERVDLWRSETLTALTALRENGAHLERVSRKICSDMGHFFSPWLLGAGPFAKVEERFRQEILDPAIRLHQVLKSSSYRYKFDATPSVVFDELSPRQLFDRYDLKDADSWLKPRSEKDVGRALYNLHPSIVRLRTSRGKNPIVITKPVMVVSNPNRETSWDQYGRGKILMDGTNLPLATAETSHAKIHNVSLSDPQTSAQVKVADDSADSGSTSASGTRRGSSNGQRTPTDLTTQTQGYLYKSPQRQVSPDLSDNDLNLKIHPRSHTEEEVPSSRRLREDQPVRSYTRGRYIEGASSTFPGQTSGQQSRQGSWREAVGTHGEKNSLRRSANEDAQPPIAPSAPMLGTSPSSVVPRGFVAGVNGLVHYSRAPHGNPHSDNGENSPKRSK